MWAERQYRYFADFTCAGLMVQAMRPLHTEQKIYAMAWIVMPDHIHWLDQLSETASLPNVMKAFNVENLDTNKNEVSSNEHDDTAAIPNGNAEIRGLGEQGNDKVRGGRGGKLADNEKPIHNGHGGVLEMEQAENVQPVEEGGNTGEAGLRSGVQKTGGGGQVSGGGSTVAGQQESGGTGLVDTGSRSGRRSGSRGKSGRIDKNSKTGADKDQTQINLVSESQDESNARTVVRINIHLAGKSTLWQKIYYDHALKKEEAVKAIARYIIANPLRAKLVERMGDSRIGMP